MANIDNHGAGGPRGSNNALYFIVGALVVAVLVIAWFMYGGADPDAGTAGTGAATEETGGAPAADADANVTVETPAAPAATDTETAPAAPATDVAPAPEPAPAAPAVPAVQPAPATPPAGGGTTNTP